MKVSYVTLLSTYQLDALQANPCCYFVSDEAVAAFVEAAGGSLNELSLNNVQKVSNLPTTLFNISPPLSIDIIP